MINLSSFIFFKRVPIRKKQPIRARLTTLVLGLAAKYVNNKNLPRWIDRSGLLSYSLQDKSGSLEITKWHDEYLFEPVKFVFLDFINIEDADDLVDNLLKLRQKGNISTGLFDNEEKKTKTRIQNISNSYKTIASGGLLRFTPNSSRYDFIESIRISYQKTEQSFIVLKFEVRTTKLFNELYLNYLKGDSFSEKTLVKFNIKNIFSKYNPIFNIGESLKTPVQNINNLLDSLNIQVKSILKNSLRNCMMIKK